MINLVNESVNLLKYLDMGTMKGIAYDTAWVARIPRNSSSAKPMFPQSLLWLFTNQKPDGSWGAELEYFHDRIISTLAAIIALSKTHGCDKFKEQIKMGESYIWYNIKNVKGLEDETVAFELLYPSLMKEAESLGLNLPYHEKLYAEEREKKLILGYGDLLSKKPSTISFSLEHLGDSFQFENIQTIQGPNGSIGNSPAATAYVLTKGYDQWAYNYISRVMKFNYDSSMGLYPFEIFEIAWIVDNFLVAEIPLKNQLKSSIQYLKNNWSEDGISMSRTYLSKDLDDTAVVFKILNSSGSKLDPKIFDSYFSENHFKCYKSELNPSIIVQIRVLDAIKDLTKFENRDVYIDKIITYLKSHLAGVTYWKDKWNASPFYTTNLALRAIGDLDPDLSSRIIDWLYETQNENGTWGFHVGNSEETAYAIQALLHYHATCEKIDLSPLKTAVKFLLKTYHNNNYLELWIGKGLYAPQNVIRSAVISALYMYEKTVEPLPAVEPDMVSTGDHNNKLELEV